MSEKLPSGELPPPASEVGVWGWLHHNLFSTPLNGALSLLALYIVYLLVPPAVSWAFINADWAGDTREACTSGGACWVFVRVHLGQFIYGFYPSEEVWRVNVVLALGLALLVPMFIDTVRYRIKLICAGLALIVYPWLAYKLMYGDAWGLPVVETIKWGGLTLTLLISAVGIVMSLPLGILLALGRRSNMPIVRSICVTFIEIWRGVPLITVLFMASVMLPLFLPEGVTFDKLLRALIGVSLFASAYMAEVVRGGLQAIAKGQYEAAEALGLSFWKSMGLIIMPQALKLVIPGIVNTFIGLFKDTTLVLIIGMFDLLGIVQAAATNAAWLGYAVEGYVFAGFGFWIFCFGMSRYALALERRLHTGHKR